MSLKYEPASVTTTQQFSAFAKDQSVGKHDRNRRRNEKISSRRAFLENTISGISDPIGNESYHKFALARDRKLHHMCGNSR